MGMATTPLGTHANPIPITGLEFDAPAPRKRKRSSASRSAGKGNTSLVGGRLDWRAEATWADMAAAHKRAADVKRSRKRNAASARSAGIASASRKRAAKARSAAARKGWATRKANANHTEVTS